MLMRVLAGGVLAGLLGLLGGSAVPEAEGGAGEGSGGGVGSGGGTGYGGSPPQCVPPTLNEACHQLSLSSLNGRCCTCTAQGIALGVMHNDQPLAPKTYFCRFY